MPGNNPEPESGIQKKGEQFVAEQMQRIERINRNLLLLSEEIQAGEDSHNI